MKNAERISRQFAAKVRKDARSNLTRRGKRNTDKLYKETDYIVQFDGKDDLLPNIKFISAEYADFVDQGVKGKKSGAVQDIWFRGRTSQVLTTTESSFKRNILNGTVTYV